jgi:hypothetical protein
MLSSGFYAMIRYIYCGKEKTILGITDLEQLFQVYILADKVSLYGQCSQQGFGSGSVGSALI